jgi:1-acyl-sn-glycerol-3-phosphate acyltransferase
VTSAAADHFHLPDVPWRAMGEVARVAAALAADDRGAFDPSRLDRRDPRVIAEVLPHLEEIARRWMHLRVEGLEYLARGRPALVVGNHNGGIMGPDLFCTMATLWRAFGPDAPLYAMAHDFAMRRVHRLGRMLQRIGAMRADPDNAVAVLRRGGIVLVYPGGDLDAFRHFSRRNEIVFGPRTGFVRVAQETGAPIVPIVAYGAHRSAIILHEGEWLAHALGLARWSRIVRFPIALALPWGVCLGPWVPYFPLPFPIRLRVLPAIDVRRDLDPRDIRDDVISRMQCAMDEMAREDAGA